MDTNTHTSTMPSATQLYDMIMRPIEADLTTENLPLLDKKYANETEEEKKKRGERYAAAFELYEKNAEKLMKIWSEHMQQIRIDILNARKGAAQKSETREISSLESQLDNA